MNIIITGGAGSLGKAFVRHLHKDNEVIVIDNNEWAVAELIKEFPDISVQLKDFEKYSFNQTPCDVLIHCAAYKHVNLGEENPHDFIDNNINKTAKLFAECYKFNVQVLFISSDKAVEPCSLYGFTKAIGEKLCYYYNGQVARLGNILNSSGSVIPVWEKCLAEGKPLPITDPEMTRYMIHEEDAVNQIWRSFKAGDKLIIPQMDKVQLIKLAQEVLKIHKKPINYPIEIIGVRPGEKMDEKLRWENE